MEKYLDLNTWARREIFEFFRTDKPYFNIATQLDVTERSAPRERQKSA